MLSSKKVCLVSLGCSKNLVDAECMSAMLSNKGYEIVNEPANAQVLVVNTCGFISSAKEEAISVILELADYKRPNGQADYLIVTGCLSQRYGPEILRELPEVDAVLGTAEYKDIAQTIEQLDQFKSRLAHLPNRAGSLEHLSVKRVPSTNSNYAYLKIAEGCSNNCSYCAIPAIRGPLLSRNKEDIIAEARYLSELGHKELILIAQETTAYGLDLYGQRRLVPLLKELCQLPKLNLIRILYAYIEGINDELITLMQEERKIARYLDLPIQHASDNILTKMKRRDTLAQIKDTVAKLRLAMPDIVLRTTVIVGFPGETEEDFALLKQVVADLRFDHLGCFIYSPEEGTAAASYDLQIEPQLAKKRYKEIMSLQKEISFAKNKQKIGSVLQVTLESIHEDGIFYLGRSYGQAPEVDPEIKVIAAQDKVRVGQTVMVKIVDADEYDLTGVTVE